MMINIAQLRDEVDNLDSQILDLLSERMKLVEKIAQEKNKQDLPLIDKNREENMRKNWIEKSELLCLDFKSIQVIFDEILKMSKNIQNMMLK